MVGLDHGIGQQLLAHGLHVALRGRVIAAGELQFDDLADALVFLAKNYSGEDIVNIGSGEEIAIADLAQLIAEVVGFAGAIDKDLSKPDGTPRKRLDTARLEQIGWRPKIKIADGIAEVYRWYVEHSSVA